MTWTTAGEVPTHSSDSQAADGLLSTSFILRDSPDRPRGNREAETSWCRRGLSSTLSQNLITREFPTWEGGGVSRAPSVARLVL